MTEVASSPGPSQQFSMFQRVTLKSWEGPGDEAMTEADHELYDCVANITVSLAPTAIIVRQTKL